MRIILIKDSTSSPAFEAIGLQAITKDSDLLAPLIQGKTLQAGANVEQGDSQFSIIGDPGYNQFLCTSGLRPCIGVVLEGTLITQTSEKKEFIILYHHQEIGKENFIDRFFALAIGDIKSRFNILDGSLVINETTTARMFGDIDLTDEAQLIKSFFDSGNKVLTLPDGVNVRIAPDHKFFSIETPEINITESTFESLGLYVNCAERIVYVHRGMHALVLDSDSEYSASSYSSGHSSGEEADALGKQFKQSRERTTLTSSEENSPEKKKPKHSGMAAAPQQEGVTLGDLPPLIPSRFILPLGVPERQLPSTPAALENQSKAIIPTKEMKDKTTPLPRVKTDEDIKPAEELKRTPTLPYK